MSHRLTADEYRDATLAFWRAIGFVTADIILHPNGAAQLAAQIQQQLDHRDDDER